MRVDRHSHCVQCGKLTEEGERTCSSECAEKRKRNVAARQNYTYVMYALMGIVVLVLVLGYVR